MKNSFLLYVILFGVASFLLLPYGLDYLYSHLKHSHLKNTEPGSEKRFATSSNGKDILNALAWYNAHALGALNPSYSLLIHLSSDVPMIARQSLSSLEILKKAGAITYDKYLFHNQNKITIKILKPFRSHVWWPGLPEPNTVLFFSPFLYSDFENLKIEKSSYPKDGNPEDLLVSFQWKIKSLSPMLQLVVSFELDLVDQHQKTWSLKSLESMIGTELTHQVRLRGSEYGYLLPLTLEPSFTLPDDIKNAETDTRTP